MKILERHGARIALQMKFINFIDLGTYARPSGGAFLRQRDD